MAKTKDGPVVDPAPVEKIQLHLDQYFERYRPDAHVYSRSYVRGQYRDILKTREEWDAIMKELGL